ncbi:hypothetical protein OROMI_022175 [Orobanche minor]
MILTTIRSVVLIIIYILIEPEILIQSQQVPCIFFYGDSQFDNGNNNVLTTLAKSNYPPYGIDYPDGPTGRFSNGQTIADFIAQLLGFANPISPFVSTRGSGILRGVNYASGSAGILDETGALVGDRITMSMQLINHRITISRIAHLLGNNQTAVNIYLNKCLYVVNMGSNDYLNNYYVTRLPTRQLYTPEQFAEILIKKLTQQLKFFGARKVAVFGLGLLGCVPQELANFPANRSGGCVDFINYGVRSFNNRLAPLVDILKTDLPDAHFTLINITNISLGDPSLLGVRVTNAPCCQVRRSTGLCTPNQVPCSNRSNYMFWDNFHPTEIANRATASRSYNAMLPDDAYPVDIRRLVQQ